MGKDRKLNALQPLSDIAIDVVGLTKRYQQKEDESPALDRIDLAVPQGSLFGLLGPNGAGKSTLINILGGLVAKSNGQARILGFDIEAHARSARRAIGIVPQELNIDPFFTPSELLDLQSGLYGVPHWARRTQEILDRVGLADKAHAYTRSLSGGMKRRLMVAKAMVHSPPVLVLDEPTAGVDIDLRHQLWDQIRELNTQGVTILLTTHYLREAEDLCDRVAIIDEGKVIACDTKDAFLKRVDSKDIVIKLAHPPRELSVKLSELGLTLAEGADRAGCLLYRCRRGELGKLERILEAIRSEGLAIEDLKIIEADLERIFLELTKKSSSHPS